MSDRTDALARSGLIVLSVLDMFTIGIGPSSSHTAPNPKTPESIARHRRVARQFGIDLGIFGNRGGGRAIGRWKGCGQSAGRTTQAPGRANGASCSGWSDSSSIRPW
ncbi:serine dehydratase beta chain [Micropruina sp.]|uniref:serine dehydratase beta chain n=1 Tax=Micropruina sp. TaxID=2737536 RepID=UPI0039E38F64